MISSVQDVKELRGQTDVLIEALRNIQRLDIERRRWRLEQWQQQRERALGREPTTSEGKQTLSASLSHCNKMSLLEEYILCHHSSFSRGSPLFTILASFHKTYDSASYDSQHCFLAVLLSLSMALWEYRTDFRASVYFLTTLTRGLKRNSIFGKKGTIANIKTLNWFLVMGGLDIRGEGGKWVDGEFLRKWAVIDAMRVIARLESGTRDKVQEALYGFLVDEREEKRGEAVSEEMFGGSRRGSTRTEEGDHGRGSGLLLDEEVLESIRAEALAGLVD